MPAQKLLARSEVDHENSTTIGLWGQKLFYIVAVTDGQTDTHFESPWTPKGKKFLTLFYAWWMVNFEPCKFSTISLCEVRFAHFTCEGKTFGLF